MILIKGAYIVALLVAVASSSALAQRPAVMANFRHADTTKQITSLDWVGLYEQLPPYRQWWKEVGTCTGIPLPATRPDSVQFYFINARDFAPLPTDKPNRMMLGVTYAAHEQIYISILKVRDEISVKHEMLHQLLYWHGEPEWDNDARVEFERCGLRLR